MGAGEGFNRPAAGARITYSYADRKIGSGARRLCPPGAPSEFAIALDQPENICGISLPPADWQE